MPITAAGKITTGLGRSLRAMALAVLLPPVLGGCIASYSTRHEEPAQPAPDAALICRYNWSADEPLFRSQNIISYEWAPASNFGHHDLAAALQELTSACPDSTSADRPDARISAHTLRHVNRFSRGVMALPMAFATGYTLGFFPFPMTDHFAVCLEMTSADGLRRAALAQGQLDRFVNMWGSSNTRHHQGKDEQRRKVDEVMRELTVHAWRKAWLPVQRDSDKIVNCREELDAIASGSARNAGQ
jgi:hypothetical protein